MTTTPTTPTTVRSLFRADGFSCPSCVAKIEKQVGALPGVTAVEVRFASAKVLVDHDPALATTDHIVAAIAKAGYPARLAAF